tara:strand:+ start:216 stop:416 length:201 start_codon:yes stop_codon:yes gene_type:complete
MRAEQHEEEEKKKLNAAVDVLAKEAEITKAKSKAKEMSKRKAKADAEDAVDKNVADLQKVAVMAKK